MKPMRPFRISMFNIADQTHFGEFYAAQVPSVGELVGFYGDYSESTREGDAFRMCSTWKVDQVVWNVSHRASQDAFRIAKEIDGDMSAAYCEWVDVLVYPAVGPHFPNTPKWAKVAAPVYHADDDEDESEATE